MNTALPSRSGWYCRSCAKQQSILRVWLKRFLPVLPAQATVRRRSYPPDAPYLLFGGWQVSQT
jgi:hypothetical protein